MAKDYQIVEKADKIDLEYEVRQLIKKGWEPTGGVTTQEIDGYREDVKTGSKTPIKITLYAQAMVKG